MLETVRTLLLHQYEAALSMLGACIAACPEATWHGPVATYRFSQVVFHTLYFTDLYLGRDDETTFRAQPFHRRLAPLFANLPAQREPFEAPAPHAYDRTALLAYLEFCRRKAAEILAGETEESLSAPNIFVSTFSRAELHVYNIRHIHHHAAQLSLRLRLDTGTGVEWAGSGWHGPAAAP